ncbi:helix-turn-helix domain-containing protein [Bacillus cereus group sp. MYBK108-2]|uniref:helix-turn-helix domain-containing protein n=1 Tax=unclassified Bacillus cereus group TaxID=2750818 RepID=UPI00289080D2|nr:helix-turn-helix transcriptional regulator [Bacillus cereus]HEF1897114.1 helix-turn-helix transcriptional regulator [Bacillus cereus]
MKYGSVIRHYRLKLGMTQSALASGICSISHLSKIENNSYKVNKEILSLLLERLNIDLNTENRKIQEIRDSIYEFIESLHYIDEDQISKKFSNLQSLEEYCLGTELINIFQLAIFKFYVHSGDLKKSEEFKKTVTMLRDSFGGYEKLIYITTLSSLLIQQNSPKEALNLLNYYSFKNNIDLNQGEYYYQLALCYSILNNTEKAIIYSKKANYYFQEECNFIKILYTQMNLAINYTRIELFEEAKIIYTKILRGFKILNNNKLYFQNLYNYSLLLKQKKEYTLALENLEYCKRNFSEGSEHAIICSLNLIELMIILKKDVNMILAEIEKVKSYTTSNRYKVYRLVAQKYEYKLQRPKKRYYKFLEDKLLPNLLSNNKYFTAAEVILELAEHHCKTDIAKSNAFFEKYFLIKKEHKL